MKTNHTALAVAGLCLALTPAFSASGPPWWETYGILDSGQEGDSYSPVNVGQLKFVATKARDYFDDRLDGGAGTAINSLVNGFGTGSDPENYAPVNVGQLKAVAKLFWDRLAVSEYAAILEPQLLIRGLDPSEFTASPVVYPWIAPGDPAEYWRPANIGQLKIVFSFHLAGGTDEGASDGPTSQSLPEQPNYVPNPRTDGSGDGMFMSMSLSGWDPWVESWFGWLYYPTQGSEEGWVYHEQHRWIFLFDDVSGDFWFFHRPFGFMFTGPDHYPALFSTSMGAWLWYHPGSDWPRWFYHFVLQEWISHHWEDSFSTNDDAFAAYVKSLAGIGELGHVASADALQWAENDEVEAAMNNPFLTSALYIVLPDQGPFVGSEAAHTVEGTPVNLLSLN